MNPGETDSATSGHWGIGNPGATNSGGAKQLDTVISDMKALVMGALPDAPAENYDLDGCMTTARSPANSLPATGSLKPSFIYNLAYGSNATTAESSPGSGVHTINTAAPAVKGGGCLLSALVSPA